MLALRGRKQLLPDRLRPFFQRARIKKCRHHGVSIAPKSGILFSNMVSEVLRLSGHIIDSLILPKVLDEIMDLEGTFEILELSVGKRKTDPSTARLRVEASSPQRLQTILRRLSRLGATPVTHKDTRLARATKPGVFPAAFYSTTNLSTDVRVGGTWRPVRNIEMDCGITVNRRMGQARCLPMANVRRGDWIVCGTEGIRVSPLERARSPQVFQFMASAVSSEKPKAQLIQRLADEMRAMRQREQKILVVAGPAVIHTGSGPFLERLIRAGFAQVLFAGNGFATHDIESSLYGTSLGVYLDRGTPAADGHDHHMRAINTIRGVGGIRAAVRRRVLTKGVMHACIKHRIPFVLAGSVRDDGPLPDVITDTLQAQEEMRKHIPGVGLALMLAST
ncbi:MAG: TIGR00300 family protein, partial [Candidatus Omnitrophota bacterium]|nr:TIGR00300 family protein [Candidatus Omnitrophota bacterium]